MHICDINLYPILGIKCDDLSLNFSQNIDGIACSFYVTMERKEMMDFTLFPAWYEVFRLVVPAPEEENRLFAFIGPFSLTVIYYVHNYVYDTVSMSSIYLSNEKHRFGS